jgi:ATP-dependent DNA ligase
LLLALAANTDWLLQVCEQELEGVVAKRLNELYRPGERAWVKTKNRAYWRYEIEREAVIRSRQRSAASSKAFSVAR